MSALQQHLAVVMDGVWSAVFGTESPIEQVDGEILAGRTMLACVHITGPQACTVTIGCTEQLARRVASTMFSSAAADLPMDDVRDALGEVANMAAGNLKALLPAGHLLSLPEVLDDAQSWIRRGHLRDRFAFRHDGELLVARIYATS